MSDSFPQDAWYAVSGAEPLRAGDVMPVRLFGVERVAWRGEGGESHIWDNQCVHRGMRLQYGFVDGDRLTCRYHGWRFGGDGKCAYIPAHPDMTPPEDYCVDSHQSVEAGELLWTSLGTPEGDPPDLSEFGPVTFCRTVTIHASAAAVVSAIGRNAGPTPKNVAPGVYAVETTYEDRALTLVIALQPVDDTRTQLHLLVGTDGSSGDLPALQKHYANWARRFRWETENAASVETPA